MSQAANNETVVSTPSGTAPTGRVSAQDPALHEQLVQPWQLCHTPLQRGNFRYRMRYLKLPGITLYREHFALRGRLVGISPADSFVIAVPLTAESHSTYWGRRLEVSGMPAMLPGGLDVTVDRGHAQVIALIDLTLLHSHLPEDVTDKLELAALAHFLPASQEDVRSLGQWLSRLINRINQMPEMINHSVVAHSVTAEILHRLSSAVQKLPDAPSPARPSVRRQGLDRALAYIRQADLSRLTIPEVAKAACVSQRTLNYAFREAFDLTPLEFVRRQRLHAARRELWRANPARTTVTKVAFRHGFHHLARFADYYLRSFGELPSSTLLRPGSPDGQRAFLSLA